MQKWLNRSICCLGCGLGWAEGSTSSITFARWRQCAHMGGRIGATWRIRLNHPSAAAMRIFNYFDHLLFLLALLRSPYGIGPRPGFVTAPTSLDQRPTKLRDAWPSTGLVAWYTIYTFWGLLPRNGILPCRCNIHFASKSCAFLFWQRYCTAPQ